MSDAICAERTHRIDQRMNTMVQFVKFSRLWEFIPCDQLTAYFWGGNHFPWYLFIYLLSLETY